MAEKEPMKPAFGLAVFLLVFLFYFGARISFFYIPIYLNELGFNGIQIGLLVALSSVAALVSFFPTGFINDSDSVKKPLLASFILLSIFYFGITFFEGFAAFFFLFLSGGIGLKIGVNSIKNYFLKTVSSGKEGERMGFFELIMMAGIISGLLCVSVLVPLIQFKAVLQGISLLFILLTGFLFLFRDIKPEKTAVSEYKKDFLKKNILFFSAILFLFTLHWGAESTSYGLLLKDFFRLDFFSTGIYMAMALAPLGFSAYYFGKKIDDGKINFQIVFLIGILVSGATHILMTVQPVEFSFAMRFIHELADGMADIGLYFWIFRSFEFKRIGGNASLIMTITVLSEILGAIIFSTIGSAYGYNWPFVLSGITSILSGALFFFYMKKYAENKKNTIKSIY